MRLPIRLALVLALAGAASSAAAAPPLTPQRARALARAVTLYASDLPGYTRSANPVTASERRSNDELASCYGGVAPSRALAFSQSPLFTQQAPPTVTEVSTAGEVLQSAALVTRDLDAFKGARALTCVAEALRAVTKLPRDARLVRIHDAFISPAGVSGVPIAFAFRVVLVARVTSGSQHADVSLYADEVVFGDGPLEGDLEVTRFGSAPAVAFERTLDERLVARAKAVLG
ncbi:MAG TPA: hypothetical protein VL977_04160 [Solirubrobacteraceae bacterium]|nr:hypothetical protein [Solirubrobacteraceae bacterium]